MRILCYVENDNLIWKDEIYDLVNCKTLLEGLLFNFEVLRNDG